MIKKAVLLLSAALAFFLGLVLSACDPGIGSIPGGYNPYQETIEEMLRDMDITELLDSKTCYNQLLEDLEFMETECYFDEQLASAQSYTILMSYGLADKSKDPSELTNEQLRTKAQLFEAIKLINVYTNTFTADGIYNQNTVLFYTQEATYYCKQMLVCF